VDKDASGFVDKEELRKHVIAHMQAQGLAPRGESLSPRTEAMTSALFDTLDVDKDGRVTVEEWVKAHAGAAKQQAEGRGDQAFEGA